MQAQTIGQTVCRAYEVLGYFSEDLLALTKSIIQQMDHARWRIMFPFRIKPWSVVLDYYAVFIPSPQTEERTCEHAIMMQVNVSGSDSWDEPLLLAAAVDLGGRVAVREIWDHWHRKGGWRAMRYLLEHPGQTVIPREMLQPDFAPAAQRAAGLVIKVCTLASAVEVAEKLVQPVLRLAGECGFESAASRL